jgi:hypothetical protein
MAQYRKDTNRYLGDGTSIFEVVMLADQYGNVIGPANPSGMAVDAFGRARVSNPLTLFDSYNRYDANGKFHTATVSGGSTTFVANTAALQMNLTTANNAQVIRESKRVFAYQPGKSLQILQTFIMNPAKEGLRQRVGYFNGENGIFLELDGDTLSFVRRSNSTGTPTDTKIAQANWNLDTLDGTGPSSLTLDISKAQIIFIDVEWLGLGTVRCGFVINGQLIHCHSFHHANEIDGPYMTTACLPVRLEITNTAETANNSTLKQVCSSVISEGGYELRGKPRSIGTPANTTVNLATAGVWYPIVSMRLKSTHIDSIVIPTNISILGEGNGGRVKYGLIENGTLSIAGGGTVTFTSANNDSSVEYNMTANVITGGIVMQQGFLGVTNQSADSVTLDRDALFKFQLERNGLTQTPAILTLAVMPGNAGDEASGSIDWEEIT